MKKPTKEPLTRRSFLKGGAGAVVAASCFGALGLSSTALASDANEPVYVCTPCGLECDKLTFDKPGVCPACGMPLIEKGERDKLAAQASNQNSSPIVGRWAGTYFVGREDTAVIFTFAGNGQALKGTVDLPGQDGGLDLASFKANDSGFSGEISFLGKKISFDAHLAGSFMTGTASVGSRRGSLRLVRLASPDVRAMRSWEGLYRAGSRTFLIELLNEQFAFTLVELPSGAMRNLFAVGANEFISGPTLLEALPEEQRFTFVEKSPDSPKLIVAHRRNRITATRLPLPREDVKFENGDVTLAGTLILPASRGPHRCVVFMHGSGNSPRTSYYGLGYWLASRGIAVLKYDKRGSGQSTGDLTQLRYEDLADDAVAGARFLQNRKEIDPKRIGFWGASEGAWTAVLAASRFPGAAFVIAADASGGGLSPAASELLDTEDQLRSDGRFSEADIQQALGFQRARDRYMQKGEGWDEYATARAMAVTKPWFGYPSTDLFGSSKADSPFWRNKALSYFYDPLPALRSLRCPLLVLAGALDDPPAIKLSLAAMRQALAAGGNRDVTFRVLPRANHDLFEAASGNTADLPRIRRLAPQFYPLVTQWLAEYARRR